MRQMLSVVGGAVILLCSVMVHGQLPGPEVPAGLGVNIHFMDGEPGELDMLARGGFGMVRTGLGWAEMEKEKGRYDFSVTDRHLDALKAKGIRPLFLLCYGNPLYEARPSKEGMFPARSVESQEAFARWAVALAKRYAGRGIVWEIWNEPNYKTFWPPEPDVNEYAKLALAASKAIHEAAPGEIIIGPATSMVDLGFLEGCFKAGLLEYWSGVSVHPYLRPGPEPVEDLYRKLRLLIDKYAPAGKKIAIVSSEWGYTTAWPGMTAELQGKMLARQWLVNLACDVPVSIWYDWHNDDNNPKDDECNFGTVEWAYHPGREDVYDPKPAYAAAKAMTQVLRGYRFNKRLAMDSPDDWVLVFTKREDVKLVAWTAAPGGARKVVIPTGPGRFVVVSHLGQELPALQADEKGLAVELTDGPVYLTPQGPNEYLNLVAAWTRLMDRAVHAPAAFTPDLMVRNTMRRPIRFFTWAEYSTMLAPGESHAAGTLYGVLPVSWPTRMRQQLHIEGYPIAHQECMLTASNPLTVTALPARRGKLPVRIGNVSGEPFSGRVTLVSSGAQAGGDAEVRIAQGQTEAIVLLPMGDPQMGFGLKLSDEKGNSMIETERQVCRPVALDLAQCQLIADGDAKVKSEQTARLAPTPQGLPTPGERAIRIDYRFEAGAKLLRLVPQAGRLSVEGKPQAMGIWVYSDGSGNAPRMRYVDATGQCFQVVADHLYGTGWRYIVFPMDGTYADHWGGANDGKPHYPLQLDTVFQLENVSQKANTGTVYIALPTFVWATAK